MSTSTAVNDGGTSPAQSYDHEKGSIPPHSNLDDNNLASDSPRRSSKALAAKSPGVARVEAISSILTTTDRILLFAGVFLVSYAYGLDGTLRYTYQPYATASFDTHSLLATVNVLRAVIAAAAQPTAAKIADVFGRAELIMVSVFFYTLGTIVEAVSTNVDAFSAGAVIYQIGYTMVIVLVEVIIADLTSTRSRLFFSYIPATPFIINTWVSGDISSAVLANSTWNWGVGMWAIIYPVCAMPLILSLLWVGRRARKQGSLDKYTSSFAGGRGHITLQLFWQLDVIGVVLLIAILGLILTPFTLAGGFGNKWAQAHIIAPLVIGLVCIPVFAVYELNYAPHPLLPIRRMGDRGIWAPMGIALFLNFCWGMQADYLYTVLIVAFDFSIKAATRITQLYSFVSVITGTILGLIVYRVRRLKPFIVAGVCLFMVAFGLMIHYRGGNGGNQSGVIGAQILLGFAGGMFPYPAQASLQVQVSHEHLAIMTGLYLAIYQVGSAFGYTVSGAMWTQVLPGELERRLAFQPNATLAAAAYGDPFTIALAYPVGTEIRDGLVASYMHVQKLLCITGLCLCVPLLVFALCIRNPRLTEAQTLAKEEGMESSDDEEVRNGAVGVVDDGKRGKWWQKVMS